MKKILTLFAMLLVTVSTLLAQQETQQQTIGRPISDFQEPAPMLSYQFVVRSNQATEKFKVNDLVFNDTLQGTFKVNTGNGSTSAVPFTAVTNLNGMLSLTVVDSRYSVTETTTPEYGLVRLDKTFEGINWKGASVTITIDAYGVNETMDIYPVPYAFYALFGNPLSTDIIVDYINQHNDGNTLDSLYKAVISNESFHLTIDSLIADAIRNNTDAVKQLLLHFLGQLEQEDLDKFYNGLTANQAVDQKLADTLADIMGRHYSTARDIVLAYIPKVTTQDVQEMCHVVNQSENSVTIYTTVLDSLCNYMKDHKDQLERAFKKAVGSSILNENNIQYALDYLQGQVYGRTTNKGVYGAMTTKLDSIIDAYLTANGYLTNKNCPAVDICQLVASIQTLENSGLRECPTMGDIETTPGTTGATQTLTVTFTNIKSEVNMNVQADSLVFELTYPGTIYKDRKDIIPADYNDATKTMSQTIDFNQYKQYGQKIKVTAVARFRCKEILTKETEIVLPLECPTLYTVSNTDAVDGNTLLTNNGVKLSATIKYNYNQVGQKGFLISSTNNLSNVNIGDAGNLPEVDVVYVEDNIDDNNTFATNLDMKYCTQKVYYKAFVECKIENTNSTYEYSDVKTIDSVRGPSIEIITAPDSLTAQGYFTIASMGGKKTLETWIQEAGNAASGMLQDVYYWWNDDNTHKTQKIANPGVGQTVTGRVSVKMFDSTCTVSKTITVGQE